MATILSGLDSTNRLIEAVGSAALVQDVAAPVTIIPIGASANAQNDGADASASGSAQTSNEPLAPLTGLFGDGLLNTIDVGNVSDIASGSNDALPSIASLDSIVQPVIANVPPADGGTGGLTNILDTSHLGDIIGGTHGSPIDLGNLGSPVQQAVETLPVVGGSDNGLHTILSMTDIGNDTDGSLLTLAGPTGTAQPLIAPVNQAIIDFHYQLYDLSQQVGLPDAVHSVLHLGETIGLGTTGATPEGQSNLVTDALNLPGNVLSGHLDGSVQSIGSDLTNIVNAADNVVTQALHGNDPTNPIPELVSSLGSNLQSVPLLTINGGNNTGDGGLLGGAVGDVAHSNSGHLVDIDVGPSQSSGLGINVLSAGDENTHTVSVNAVDVGPSGPHLLDLGVLTTPGITAPLAGQSALPLPAVADIASAAHGILDVHSAHII